MDAAAHRLETLQFRAMKDDYFKRAPDSPIPPGERAAFEGLRYYPPDPRYRFEVPLVPLPPEEIRIPRSAGDEVTYLRVGAFDLATPEGPVRLAAFHAEGHEEGVLFIPFRDGTSGKETYGAGRYLEAAPVGGGNYLVDLNLAYHPFCAYDDAYSCPLPPRENWTNVPLRAGERLP